MSDLLALDEETLSHLTAEEQADFARIYASLIGPEGLADFITRLWPDEAPLPHLMPIIQQIERARTERLKVCISMPPRHGKLVADSTPILTPDGWRTHGDLVVGDLVYAPDGTPTKITYVTPKGVADWAVTFSDGEVIKVNAQHRWRVFSRGQGYRVFETAQILSKGLVSGTCQNGKPRARFLVDYTKPLAGRHTVLPCDPYLLGLWLGDGSIGHGRITGTPADAEHHMQEAKSRGYSIGSVNVHKDTGVVTFNILKLGLGRLKAKRLPQECFVASEEQRREILRGLVDSDGCVDPSGRCRFVNTDKTLIDDVQRLVATLGYPVTTEFRPTKERNRPIRDIKPVWCVSWTPTDGAQQARLPRKDIRHRALERKRSIVSIEASQPEQGHCIAVEHPSHLYVVGDKLVPTHNTETLKRGVAWWLKYWPADTCCYTTYSDRKAWSKSIKFREAAHKAGVAFAKPNTGPEWRTKEGGGLLAAGAGGGLTGEGIHGLALVDDPFKNAADASSEVVRERVWEWFNSVLMTRLEGASVIVVHTRWHEDDLIGRLEEQGGWEIINLPALAEEITDPMGRPMGVALWRDRFTREYLEGLRIQLGEYTFSALYQGRPIAKGAKIFGEAHYYDPHKIDLDGATATIGADPATGERQGLDYSVATAFAIKFDKTGLPWVYISDVERSLLNLPSFARFLIEFQRQNWYGPINLETVGAFKGIAQIMKESEHDIILNELQGNDLEGNKFLRCQRFAAAWNAGRVLIPTCIPPWSPKYNPMKPYQPVPWVADYLKEIGKFTGMGDAHDDQVDASAHAFNSVVKRVALVTRGAYSDAARYGVR